MANRITGRDVTLTLTGLGTDGNKGYTGEVDSFSLTYTPERQDTRPINSKSPYKQITGGTWSTTMDGGITGALYINLAKTQDNNYRNGRPTQKMTLHAHGINTVDNSTFDVTLGGGVIAGSNAQVGQTNALATQQLQLDFDTCD